MTHGFSWEGLGVFLRRPSCTDRYTSWVDILWPRINLKMGTAVFLKSRANNQTKPGLYQASRPPRLLNRDGRGWRPMRATRRPRQASHAATTTTLSVDGASGPSHGPRGLPETRDDSTAVGDSQETVDPASRRHGSPPFEPPTVQQTRLLCSCCCRCRCWSGASLPVLSS